jgi:hypothetical protein
MLNYEGLEPDYYRVYLLIHKILDDLSKPELNLEVYLKSVFSQNSIIILKRVATSKEKLKEIVIWYFNLLSELFLCSAIKYAYTNNKDLSFLIQILQVDSDFFKKLLNTIKNVDLMPNHYQAYYEMSVEELIQEKKVIVADRLMDQRSKNKLLNVVSTALITEDQLDSLRDKLLACNSTYLSLSVVEKELFQILTLRAIISLNFLFCEKFKRLPEKNKEKLLTDTLMRLTAEAQPEEVQKSIQNQVDNCMPVRFYNAFSSALIEKGIISSPDDLVWVNSSDSPADILRNTDAFFIIKKGKYKDIGIPLDITTIKKGQSKWRVINFYLPPSFQKRDFDDAVLTFIKMALGQIGLIDLNNKADSPYYFEGLSERISK